MRTAQFDPSVKAQCRSVAILVLRLTWDITVRRCELTRRAEVSGYLKQREIAR